MAFTIEKKGRQFDISVVISEGEGTHSYAVTHRKEDGAYKIVVSKSESAKHGLHPAFVALHELGHVLCAEFDAPANNAYIEWQKAGLISFAPPDMILQAEREAWDVAELLVKLLEHKRYALGKYEEAFSRVEPPRWLKL